MKQDAIPTRERQRLETRERIYNAALEEITDVGMARTAIGRIARRVGVTRPTIYKHFRSKEDFLWERVRRNEIGVADQTSVDIGDVGELEGFDRLIDAMFDSVVETNDRLRREIISLIVRDPPKADWEENPFLVTVRQLFSQAQERGEIRADLDTFELSKGFAFGVFGFMMLETLGLEERKSLCKFMTGLVLDGARKVEHAAGSQATAASNDGDAGSAALLKKIPNHG